MKNYVPLLLQLLVFGHKLFASTNANKTCRQVHVDPSWTIQQFIDFQYYSNMVTNDPDRKHCIEASIQSALRQRKLVVSEDNIVETDKDRAIGQSYLAFEAALSEALHSYDYQKLAAEDTKLQDFVTNISRELDSQTRGTQGKWTMKSNVTSLQKFIDYIGSELPAVISIPHIQKLYNNVSEWKDIPAGVGPVTRLKNNLIQSTITKVTHTLEENGKKLIINGLYLRMSDVVVILYQLRLSKGEPKYRGGVKLDEINDPEIEATKHVEIIEIQSQHIFYVDDSLHLRRSPLVIIAPVWKIVRESVITVAAPYPDQYPEGDEAPYGEGAGADGNPGKPGHPGKPGANFFALAFEVDHPEKLTIHMQGGISGDGQAGSDGAKGKNGRAIDFGPVVPGMHEDDVNRYFDEKNYKGGIWGEDKVLGYYRLVKAYCESGEKGGDGGAGGPPGEPGKPGIGAFLILKETSGTVKITKKDGEKGSKGRDGKGGKGGDTAPRKTVQFHNSLVTGFRNLVSSLELHPVTGKKECDNDKAAAGKDGGKKHDTITLEPSANPKWPFGPCCNINDELQFTNYKLQATND